MNWVNLPGGIRLMRNKSIEHEDKHEFNFRDSEHIGPGVKFTMQCADFSELPELDGDQGYSYVRTFWQQVYGNGLWHPAYEGHKSPRMQTAGVYALYTRYVRGMLGEEGAAHAIALAKEDKWDFQYLAGMTFFVNLIHKSGTDRDGNACTYVNLAPFSEGGPCFDFERSNALCAMSVDHIGENVKVLNAHLAESGGGADLGRDAERYLRDELLPTIKKLNAWDKEGVATVEAVRFATGEVVSKLSMINELRKRGGRFGNLKWDDQVLFLSELARAVSYVTNDDPPEPTESLGGAKLWYGDVAVMAPVWSGYEQYDPQYDPEEAHLG